MAIDGVNVDFVAMLFHQPAEGADMIAVRMREKPPGHPSAQHPQLAIKCFRFRFKAAVDNQDQSFILVNEGFANGIRR